mmetsp:Transcript_39467/g.35221  ORF Transcript_39467/g.35221 Transcript_39467/m.35221 type:complete len:167 (-) Transcript_39467:193-693(-)
MLLNYAKFEGNGGVTCGYKTKPNYLMSAQTKEEEKYQKYFPSDIKDPVKQLTIQVISGQHIRYEDFKFTEVLDPCVEIKVVGHPVDEKNNSSKKNKIISDNGFHPYWGDSKDTIFDLKIASPEHAQIVFKVFDDDVVKQKRITWYAINFEDIVEGYRAVPLLNASF